MSIRPPLLRAFAVVALTFAVAACGATGSSGTGSQPAGGVGPTLPPGGTVVATAAGGGAGPVTGHVGAKLTFPFLGTTVDVTLVKVTDPVVLADDTTAPAGTRWVGAEIIITNRSPDIASEGDGADAIGSDGQTIIGDDVLFSAGFAGCTPTPGDPMDVQPGEPYTACMAIPVPTGITVASVGFRLGAGAVDQATWSIP